MAIHLKGWRDMMPRRTLAEKALGQALKYLGDDPDKNAGYVLKAGIWMLSARINGSIFW